MEGSVVFKYAGSSPKKERMRQLARLGKRIPGEIRILETLTL